MNSPIPLRLQMPPLFLLLTCATMVAGCSPGTEPTQSTTSVNAPKANPPKTDVKESQALKATTKAQRLVTLGGTVTEIVFALGHGAHVVGTDTSSTYPKTAFKLPKVGYYRKLSAEGVLALRPTRILAVSGLAPQSAVEQLKQTGVSIDTVDGGEGVELAITRVKKLGKMLKEEKKAEVIIADMKKALKVVRDRQANVQKRPRVLFVYARGANVLMVAGKKTSADTMLTLAGAQNAIEGFDGFKPLTPESVVVAKPDYIVIPEKGAQSIGGESQVLKLPGVGQTPAGKNKKVVTIDDLKLLGFGPRFPDALSELQQKLSIGVK